MKSKTILPEELRYTGEDGICWINDAKQGKYDNIGSWIKGHTEALLAAENEIEENLNQFTETFKKKDDELREKVIQIQELKKEIREYKKLANAKELAQRLKERKI